MNNNLLKIAATVNLTLGVALIPYFTYWSIILLITGIILLSYSDLSPTEIQSRNISLIIISILMFLTNIISFFLIIITLSEAAETTQNKKIDNSIILKALRHQ